MRPTTLTIAALIAASPALAARCPPGQLYRVRLDECVSLNSPLARPYLYSANLGKKIDTRPVGGRPAAVDPPAEQPPPDEVDEAAWLMIPLLRAAEVRWAIMVSPLRVQTPRDPWPSLSVYGLGNKGQDFLPPAP
jgi:hypothetical protein